MKLTNFATLAAGALVASAASAADIDVTANISGSETWTADNTYNLVGQIFVEDGATLTIEAGTVIANDTGAGGSLAVSRGGQLFVKGTQFEPVIMTSKADVATWTPDPSHPTGGDPRTGNWRLEANEWGNLTIMGRGYISENAVPGNTPAPNAANIAPMEGLQAGAGVPQAAVQYGGGNDEDDSGSISYLSIRYGGNVIALNNELNGLSLGAIGSETDIDHVEIMNNVDDGIEIWGGCVNLKYISIWNIGDDSLDIDQGYRGKIQFGLIVQGASIDAPQGSGVGDNAIEVDGAEDSDWQPRTRTTMYNMTVVGQPLSGDGGTAWRDNAGVQYRNSIWMDLGEQLVRFDDDDGDQANGYGHNGTLSWADHWTTADTVTPVVNEAANPGDFYKSQFGGNICEIKDSVFFRNLAPNAYTEATARGVLNTPNGNVVPLGVLDSDAPVTAITRGSLQVLGGLNQLQVTFLDPRPANEALVSVGSAPNDGFFVEANYRGAFAPAANAGDNWLCGWSASDAYDFTPGGCNYYDLGCAKAGVNGFPQLLGTGDFSDSGLGNLSITRGPASTLAILFASLNETAATFKGGTLKTLPILLQVGLGTDPNGELNLPILLPAPFPAGISVFLQAGLADATDPQGVSITNAIRAISN